MEMTARTAERTMIRGLYLIAGVTLLVLGVLAWRHSWFEIEDILHFRDWQQQSLWRALWTPIDVYRLPLHQLASGWFFSILGMHFGAAVLVMLGVLLADLVLLSAIFRRLGVNSFWSAIVLFAVACNVYVLDLLTWWSAALHRLPYVFFCLLTCWAWLAYRQQGRRYHALLCILGVLCGLGFYAKAVLIPAFVVLLELVLLADGQPAQHPTGRLGAALVVLDLAYVVASLVWPIGNHSSVLIDGYTPAIVWSASQHYLLAWLPMTAHLDHSFGPQGQQIAALSLLALLTLAVIRRPRSGPFWIGFILALGANALLISISVQIRRFGVFALELDRYYFEAIPISAIFLGVALQRTLETGRLRRLPWAVLILGLVFAWSDVSVSRAEYQRTLFFRYYDGTARLMHKVMHQIAQLPPGSCLRDTAMPEIIVPHIYGMVQPWSLLLELFPLHIAIKNDPGCYRISNSGDLQRDTQEPASQGKGSELRTPAT